MRALRERPRVTVAKFVAIGLVFLLGMAFAVAVSDDEPKVPPATAKALDRAERAAHTRGNQLEEDAQRVDRLERRVSLLERRLRVSGSRNRRLSRALRTARRRLAEK